MNTKITKNEIQHKKYREIINTAKFKQIRIVTVMLNKM